MIDPEVDHRRIVSGDARALTSAADTLADVGHELDDARGRIHDAAAATDWSGPAAVGFQARIAQLANGVNVNRSAIARARGAGLVLSVRDLFDHQTAETLAAAIGGRPAAASETDSAASAAAAESPLLTFADDEFGEFEDIDAGLQASEAEGEWETLT